LTEEQVMNVFSIAMSIPSEGQSSKELNFGPKDKGSIKWHKTDQGFDIPGSWDWNTDKQTLEKKAEAAKTDKDDETEQGPEFDLNIQFNYFLEDGEKMPTDKEIKPGRGSLRRTDMGPSKALRQAVTKMLNDYNSNEFNQVDYFKAEYLPAASGNLILTKPKKANEPITVSVRFKVKTDPSFVKQVKDSGLNFNSPQVQDELNNYISQAFKKKQGNKTSRTAFRNMLLSPFVATRDSEVEFNDTLNKFNNKPQISKTEWDFENASTQTALARGSEDVEDPYEVSAFNKRKRLIEYIPTNFLKFSNKDIFTVTFDLPGNGFDEFLAANPTVIRGREPFNKSAPGEMEADRRVLVAMLKRNRAIFMKFLDKLEELAQDIGEGGRMKRIEYGRYTKADYRIYKQWFQSYIKLFDGAISAIENVGEDDFDSILKRSYSVNLLSAVIYNLA